MNPWPSNYSEIGAMAPQITWTTELYSFIGFDLGLITQGLGLTQWYSDYLYMYIMAAATSSRAPADHTHHIDHTHTTCTRMLQCHGRKHRVPVTDLDPKNTRKMIWSGEIPIAKTTSHNNYFMGTQTYRLVREYWGEKYNMTGHKFGTERCYKL